MGALIGLCLGCGVLSVWLAFSSGGRSSQTGGREGNRAAAGHARRRRHQLSAASGLVAGVLAYLLTGLAIAGVMAAVAGSFLPRIVEDRKRQRDAHRRRQAWPDVIDSLVSAVRAGMSLPEAVAAVGVRGPQVVRPAFVRFAADYRASGRFTDCILRLRDDVQDPVADRIVEALLAARDVGGSDLGRMLRTLSDFVRQDLRFRGEAEARRSWTVNGARLAIAAPWLVLLLLSTRPEAAVAYQTSAGMFVLVACAGACVLAYYLMTRIGRLPDEVRVML
ncbi:MAG: type II secretion system F family protein [Candidatus Nanopelagicales bacterium]|jgi:tight adherence protein B